MTFVHPPRQSSPFLALRYALRELRSGLRGFYVFFACIALGVTAIAGVGSVAESLNAGLEHQGRVLLGGDISFALVQREASREERAFLDRHGTVTVAALLRGMARSSANENALVEVKAVDANYPMLGDVEVEPPMSMKALLAEQDNAFGAAADPVLLARLNLKLGDRIMLGNASFTLRSIVVSEPDKLAGGIGFGPRLLISEAGLRATQLLQPGSLVRWIYRLRVGGGATSNAAISAVIDDAQRALPQTGWEVRSQSNASPQLERSITRFTQFLTLVGLAALLVGGVGVANAVRSHLDSRRDVIATFKTLGATSRGVFLIYLTQIMTLAAVGSSVGLVIGGALPFLVVGLFHTMLPLPVEPAFDLGGLMLAFAYGLLTALAFALWPLGRVRDIGVAALFRETVAPEFKRPRWPYLVLMAAVVMLLAAIAIGLAYDKRVASVFVASAAGVFIMLRGIAALLMTAAKALPRTKSPLLRMAIANIHRPGALTPSIVISLGLGLAVLVTVTQIDGNLRQQFMAQLPDRAPSFFFIDIPSAASERFSAFLKAKAPASTIETVPMLRGRIIAANGVKAEDMKPSTDAAWVLQSDRGLTIASDVPRGSRVVAGQWWDPNYVGPPLVSLESRIADGLKLKVGDPITVNVLGRDITAKVANLRAVDWQNLGINFVLVFSPNTFAGAPHTHIATLTESSATVADDARLIRAVADAFPMVTSVRVREALESVGGVVTKLVLAIRGASSVTLVAAILVLGGALAAGHRGRVYDAVILKTLGATRTQLIGAYALEYLLIGLATAIFGVAAGSIAAWQITTRLMTLSFVWQVGSATLTVVAALIVTVGLGLVGTLLALGQKPASVLRNL